MLFRYACAATIAVILGGCATITGTQADCFAKYDRFAEAAACMKAEMPKLRWASNAPLSALRDYEVYLGLLESKVKKGEISDEDAKLRMQEYLTRLRASYR